ncbi:Glutamyl-tRNA reductase [Frankliniella fusca]|uniref:Glutamyl-tRNA reductase n=1 Tax=Frankliniella fusca TaxID=407009 RepID=A0AAE1H683_9NEOP|nr:Glutamyl-tRNA reductase [Frankliniella fusca]
MIKNNLQNGEQMIKKRKKDEQGTTELGPKPSFWDTFEVRLEPYLRSLLEYNGYDNIYSLSKLTSEEQFNELVEFGRNILVQMVPKDATDEKKKEYFGPYYAVPHMFNIPSGHKVLLREMTSICIERIKEKNRKPVDLKSPRNKVNNQIQHKNTAAERKDSVNGKDPVPVQLEQQKATLDALVKNSIESMVEIPKKERDRLKEPTTSVTEENGVVKGLIICPSCPVKNAYPEGLSFSVYLTNGRWILANYRRHVKNKHTPPKKPSNQISVDKLLQKSPGKNVEDSPGKSSCTPQKNLSSEHVVIEPDIIMDIGSDSDDNVTPIKRKKKSPLEDYDETEDETAGFSGRLSDPEGQSSEMLSTGDITSTPISDTAEADKNF